MSNKYPGFSPFNFCINTPIQAKDPDGKDVYLVIWNTSNGNPGHAGIAVDNYKQVSEKVIVNGKTVTKTNWVPDGTVTFYDFGPTKSVGKTNVNKNVNGEMHKIENISINELLSEDIYSGKYRPAEGVIKLGATYNMTQRVKEFADGKYSNQDKDKPQYNGIENNCSDFALKCLNEIYNLNGRFGLENINTDGNSVLMLPAINSLSATPNFLFKDASNMIKQNSNKGEVMKKDPDKENKDFVDEVAKGHAEDKTPGK